MNKIIHRIVKFQKAGRNVFDPKQKLIDGEINDYLLFSCMDKRINPNDFTKIPLGHLFVVRNAGNFVPRSDHHNNAEISTEGGAIEFAVKKLGIRDIMVSGHSDCKALQFLSQIYQQSSEESKSTGPLSQWVRKYGAESYKKFQQYSANRFNPVKFQLQPEPLPINNAYIDANLNLVDCLSQINCLQQAENIASFPFIRQELMDKRVKVHILWKDLTDKFEDPILYLFDSKEERFLKICEENLDKLIKDENN